MENSIKTEKFALTTLLQFVEETKENGYHGSLDHLMETFEIIKSKRANLRSYLIKNKVFKKSGTYKSPIYHYNLDSPATEGFSEKVYRELDKIRKTKNAKYLQNRKDKESENLRIERQLTDKKKADKISEDASEFKIVTPRLVTLSALNKLSNMGTINCYLGNFLINFGIVKNESRLMSQALYKLGFVINSGTKLYPKISLTDEAVLDQVGVETIFASMREILAKKAIESNTIIAKEKIKRISKVQPEPDFEVDEIENFPTIEIVDKFFDLHLESFGKPKEIIISEVLFINFLDEIGVKYNLNNDDLELRLVSYRKTAMSVSVNNPDLDFRIQIK